MGADNNFTIGATFDKSQLDASMAEGAAAINQIPQAFDVAFKEVSATTTRALRQISEETRSAAAFIGQDWIEVAAATQEYTAAQREVRAASKLAADGSLNEAESLSVLAAAKQRAAAASASLNAAEGEATTTAAKEAVAENTLAESLAHLRERVTLTSEGIRSSLFDTAGLSGALGAALGVGILGEYVNELKESEMELGHLSESSGVTVASLARLQAAFQLQGVPIDNFSAVLTRLAEHMVEAQRGDKSMADYFAAAGVSAADLANQNLKLDDILQLMASHLEKNAGNAQDLGAVYALLGRGAGAFVAGLKGLNKTLKDNREHIDDLAAAHIKAMKSANELDETEQRLGQTVKTVMLPVLPMVTLALKLVGTAFDTVAASVELLLAPLLELGNNFLHVGQAVYDASHYRFAAAKADMQAATQDLLNIKSDWVGIEKDYVAQVEQLWKDVKAAPPSEGQPPPLHPPGPSANALRNQKLQAMEQELADEQTQHSVSLGEELQFWASKEGIFKEGTAQRLAIDKKIAALEAEIAKSSADLQKKFAEAGASAYRDSQKQLTDDLAKDLDVCTQAVLAAYRDQSAAGKEYAAGEEAHGMASLELARQEVEQRRQLGQESARNAIADLQQIAAAEHDLRMKTLQAKLSDDQALQAAGIPNRAAVQADLNAIEAEQDNFRAKISGIHAQIAEESKRTWDAIGQTINRAFSESIQGVIQGTQSMSQAFRKMEVSILASTIQTLEQMAMRYLLHEAQMTVMHAAGVEHRVATTAAGAAQEKSIGLLAMMEHITREAARTAASTFRSVMSTVPFPANAILAPIEAGAAFAGVEAFGALSSARGGQWEVPQPEQLTLLHAKEMVLPAQYAEPLRQTVTAGKGTRGGDIHLHINAVDAKSFETMLSDNSSALVRTLRKAHRSGMLTGRVS